jgi:hypothetical protein
VPTVPSRDGGEAAGEDEGEDEGEVEGGDANLCSCCARVVTLPVACAALAAAPVASFSSCCGVDAWYCCIPLNTIFNPSAATSSVVSTS